MLENLPCAGAVREADVNAHDGAIVIFPDFAKRLCVKLASPIHHDAVEGVHSA